MLNIFISLVLLLVSTFLAYALWYIIFGRKRIGGIRDEADKKKTNKKKPQLTLNEIMGYDFIEIRHIYDNRTISQSSGPRPIPSPQERKQDGIPGINETRIGVTGSQDDDIEEIASTNNDRIIQLGKERDTSAKKNENKEVPQQDLLDKTKEDAANITDDQAILFNSEWPENEEDDIENKDEMLNWMLKGINTEEEEGMTESLVIPYEKEENEDEFEGKDYDDIQQKIHDILIESKSNSPEDDDFIKEITNADKTE
jgi:hypothetical protein